MVVEVIHAIRRCIAPKVVSVVHHVVPVKTVVHISIEIVVAVVHIPIEIGIVHGVKISIVIHISVEIVIVVHGVKVPVIEVRVIVEMVAALATTVIEIVARVSPIVSIVEVIVSIVIEISSPIGVPIEIVIEIVVPAFEIVVHTPIAVIHISFVRHSIGVIHHVPSAIVIPHHAIITVTVHIPIAVVTQIVYHIRPFHAAVTVAAIHAISDHVVPIAIYVHVAVVHHIHVAVVHHMHIHLATFLGTPIVPVHHRTSSIQRVATVHWVRIVPVHKAVSHVVVRHHHVVVWHIHISPEISVWVAIHRTIALVILIVDHVTIAVHHHIAIHGVHVIRPTAAIGVHGMGVLRHVVSASVLLRCVATIRCRCRLARDGVPRSQGRDSRCR